MNLPLGIASVLLIHFGLKESKSPGARPTVDWAGISLLAGWVVLLNLALLNGGSSHLWLSLQELALFMGTGVAFTVFLLVERRSREPLLPLGLFRARTVASASAVSFLRGVSLFGVVTFVPLFVQAGLGGSINEGRNVLNALLVPMIAGSLLGGQLCTRLGGGYRNVAFTGLSGMTLGAFLLAFFSSSASYPQIMASAAVLGFGVGMTFPTIVLAIQYSVERRYIGIGSSLALFMGNLGGTVGLAILGAVQTSIFTTRLFHALPSASDGQSAVFLADPDMVGRILATPSALASLLGDNPALAALVPSLRESFAESVGTVFWLGFLIALAALGVSLLITGSFKKQTSAGHPPRGAVPEAASA